MTHLRPKQEYIDLYDRATIEDCRRRENFHKNYKPPEEQAKKDNKKFFEGITEMCIHYDLLFTTLHWWEKKEKAIQDWIIRRKAKEPEWNVSFEAPPTVYDDIHTLELIPTLEVVYPQPNSIITSRQIFSNIRVSAPRGVKKVYYKIDRAYVAVVNQPPFNLNYYAKKIDPGAHSLTITVEDDVGNKLSEIIPFILDVPEELPALYFNKMPLSVSEVDFPVVIFFDPYKLDQIKEISIKAIRLVDLTTLTILHQTDFSNLFNNQIIATWKNKPASGAWKVVASVTLKTGEVKETDHQEIEIK